MHIKHIINSYCYLIKIKENAVNDLITYLLYYEKNILLYHEYCSTMFTLYYWLSKILYYSCLLHFYIKVDVIILYRIIFVHSQRNRLQCSVVTYRPTTNTSWRAPATRKRQFTKWYISERDTIKSNVQIRSSDCVCRDDFIDRRLWRIYVLSKW